MHLSPEELEFIRRMANIWSDQRIADELSRIRQDLGVKDSITMRRVGRNRRNLNIKKSQGRNAYVIKKEHKDDK